MALRELLSQVECAEDLFTLFAVEYDARVVNSHRFLVLRWFGAAAQELDRARAGTPRTYAAALKGVYERCASGAAPESTFAQRDPRLVPLGRKRPK